MELDLQPDNSGREVVLLMTSHSPNTHTYTSREGEEGEEGEVHLLDTGHCLVDLTVGQTYLSLSILTCWCHH